jgi:competence protein ComEC
MLIAAAAGWATAAIATLLAVPVVAGAAIVGGLLAVVVRRRAVVVAIGIGMFLAAASTAIHLHQLHTGPVASLAARHAEVEVVARLVRDPEPVVSGSGTPFTLVDATVVEVLGGRPQHTSAPVLLLSFGGGWQGLLPGQRVDVSGRLEPPRPYDDVAAVIDVRGTPRPIGRPVWWQRAAGHARAALLAACAGLPADSRGLLPGLVDGDTSRVPAALQTDMRATGLTHLEAVSGENLTIVLGVVMALARGAGLRRRSRVVVAAVAVVAFVWLARPSPSVLRAAVMSAVALLAMYAGRRTSALPTLSLAVLILVVIDPFLARSVGFVLSVVATAAIVVIAPGWTRRLERRFPKPIAIAIAVPAAAQLACTPVLVLAFAQLTPYAVPANLVAGPAVAPATVLGLIGAVLASASVGLAEPLVWVGALPTACIAWTAHGFAAFPGAAITLSRSVAIVTAVAATGLLWRIVKRRAASETREIL